jgi:putative intracellular protease/amidase
MSNAFFTAVLLAAFVSVSAGAATPSDVRPLNGGTIKVAFVISENANVMDIAGSWEVFQDTTLDDGEETSPFELYTVAPSTAPLHTAGSNRSGMTITPDYSFDDAPTPDIVVVGAQSGGPALSAWLQRQHAQQKTILSICTGAFKLAEAGLLKGKPATTHHWYFGSFAEQFPDTTLVREVRYVRADPRTYTAGGLSSGIDLSLHIVAAYFGQAQAQRTADYMEYQGLGWKSNVGTAEMTAPVKRELWSGKIAPETDILLYVLTTGASKRFTVDIPSRHIAGARTTLKSDGAKVSFAFPVAGQLVTFSGEGARGSSEIAGTLVEDGKPYPLTLTFMGTQ